MLIQGTQSIGVLGTVANLLAGSVFEFLPWNARVAFGLTQDTNGDLVATVTSGNDVLMEESPFSTANRFPINPDDFVLTDVARAGEKLTIRIRNTDAAAARVVFFSVDLTPLGA